MPATVRTVDPRLVSYATRHGLSLRAARAQLVTIALAHLEARGAGARTAHASRTPAERSELGRRAIAARWAKHQEAPPV